MMEPFNINENKKGEDFIQELEKLKKQLENLKGSINEKTIELFSVTIILLNRLYETITTQISSQKQKNRKDIPKDFETDIFIACEEGKLSSVEYLINEVGLNEANEYNEKGESLLHIATRKGHLPLVSYLIEKGADKEGKDQNGDTPLHYACKFGHLHLVNYLIKDCGVSLNQFDNNNETPFITALKNQKTIIEQYFIKKLSYPRDIEPNIFIACEEGKLQNVQWLIEKEKVTPNLSNENGDFPIHFASKNGHLSIIEYLISKGANIEAKDKYERTPLHYACQEGHIEIVEYLISKGANAEAKDIYEQTPHLIASENNDLPSNLRPLIIYLTTNKPRDYEPNIFQACKEGKLTSVQWLIEQENEYNKNITDSDKKTPLHYACEEGHLPIVKYLISKGANIEARDKDEKTALHYATFRGDYPIIEYLISKGANLKAKNKYGQTPLHYACQKDNISNAYYLVKKGANMEEPDKYGQTPLWLASQKGHKKFIKFALIMNHLPSNYEPVLYSIITEKPKDFLPNIFQACKEGRITTVQWLIEKLNLDPNKADSDEKTPLHIACEYGHLPIVAFLISKGSNLEAKFEYGKTPLHIACENDHLPIVEYLLSRGAYIEAKDLDGKTPLHFACMQGHLQIVDYLISAGANIQAITNRERSTKWTPLHFASYNGKTDVVKFLVSKGANKYARDRSSKTPFDYAQNDEIRNILKRK